MRSVLTTALEGLHGALEQEQLSDGGYVFHRMPKRALDRLDDPGLEFVSTSPSGVRLHVATDASVLRLVVEVSRVHVAGLPVPAPRSIQVVMEGGATIEVPLPRERTYTVDVTTRSIQSEPTKTSVDIQLGESTSRELEIWLPPSGRFVLYDVLVPDEASIEARHDRSPVWIHHGSSISQCAEVTRPLDTWPALVARASGRSLINLGVGGSCHVDPFMAESIAQRPADLITLSFGINVINGETMRERAFVPAVHGFLDAIRKAHPVTPLVLVSPVWCPAHEDAPGPSFPGPGGVFRAMDWPPELRQGTLTLRRVRELLCALVERRAAEGDANMAYIDGLRLFGPDDVGDLPDGLHPNAAGYRRLAHRFERELDAVLTQ